MNYRQTVDYLYAQLPMFSHIGAAAYKKDLGNTLALCSFLGDPHKRFRKIHIAGTNGKGSTSHMLASVLQEAGYRTGLYTSPHIKDFRERIRVNGEMVSEDFVVEFVERTKAVSEDIKPSFFELTVAMAFDHFAKEQVDIAIIETGLGGLLDSTNVITPLLSVITNIGYDHQNILGNTLEEIATQKAGIIKERVPVVIGETLPGTRKIFSDTAAAKLSSIIFTEDDYRVEYIEFLGNLLLCHIKCLHTGITEKLRLGLTGIYQTKNAATVLAAVHQLQKLGFDIPEAALHTGVENVASNTGLRGRWDILNNHPHIIADVAHNADGIKQVIYQANMYYSNAKMHFVLGFVKDKDVETVLKLFPDNASYYFTNAHIPRALPAPELKEKALAYNLRGDVYENVNDAVAAARSFAEKDDLILICGSFFIIAELNIL